MITPSRMEAPSIDNQIEVRKKNGMNEKVDVGSEIRDLHHDSGRCYFTCGLPSLLPPIWTADGQEAGV